MKSFRKVFKAFFVFVILALVLFPKIYETGTSAEATSSTWQVVSHFPTSMNQVPAMQEFKGKLYASVLPASDNPEVWVSDSDGLNWSKNQDYSDALLTIVNGGTFYNRMIVFNNTLYVIASFSSEGTGVLVLKTGDGTTWDISYPETLQTVTQINTVQVYNDKLYLFGRSDSGLVIFRTSDGTNFDVVGSPELDTDLFLENMCYAFTSQIFNNKLYVGVSDDGTGDNAQVWYTSDGTTWQKTSGGMDGYELNEKVTSSFVFNNQLYMVTYSFSGGSSIHLFKSSDGETWSDVHAGGLPSQMGFKFAAKYGSQAVVLNNTVYLSIADTSVGAGIYSSTDGITWTLEPTHTPNPDSGYSDVETLTLFGGRLYTAIDRFDPEMLAENNLFDPVFAHAEDLDLSEGAAILRSEVINITSANNQTAATADSTPSLTVLPETGNGH